MNQESGYVIGLVLGGMIIHLQQINGTISAILGGAALLILFLFVKENQKKDAKSEDGGEND